MTRPLNRADPRAQFLPRENWALFIGDLHPAGNAISIATTRPTKGTFAKGMMMFEIKFEDGSLQGPCNVLEALQAVNQVCPAAVSVHQVIPEDGGDRRVLSILSHEGSFRRKRGFTVDCDGDTLLKLVMEAAAAVLQPQGDVVLRPWELPKQEWDRVCLASSYLFGVLPGVTGQQRTVLHEVGARPITDALEKDFRQRFGYSRHGPAYAQDADGYSLYNERHDIQVGYALLRGEAVPDNALGTYLLDAARSDLRWITCLAQSPWARGWRDADAFSAAYSLLERDGSPLTEELVGTLRKVLSTLAPSPSYEAVDDALYQAGLLKPLEMPGAPAATVVSEDAEVGILYQSLLASVIEKEKDAILQDRAAGRDSLRRHQQRLAMLQVRADTGEAWLLRSAESTLQAVRQRDVSRLLDLLDTGETHNRVSKQFLRQHFGLNLKGLNSEGRKKRIFEFCGYDEDARTRWQADRQARRDVAQQRQELEDACREAELTQVRTEDGRVVTTRQFVDELVAKGYTEVRALKKGSVPRYYLVNKEGLGWPLSVKTGSLRYARAVTKAAAPAEEEVV